MHLITRISVIGIAITTAALVILVAAFNGIEGMVKKLYSEYDAPITIRSEQGKTFAENTVDLNQLRKIEGVKTVSRAVEELVILKHESKWANAEMVGVDPDFLLTCSIEKHVVDGYPALEENGKPIGIIGASLLDKIGGFLDAGATGHEQLILYTPLREASISRRKSPFKTSELAIGCRMNYNREVNIGQLLVPLEFAQEQLNYDKTVTALYVDVDDRDDVDAVKERLVQKLGKNFTVKTAAEKNELIYKTSRTEKRIVVIILVFVFILAAFNLIASLTMLFIEKKENIETMAHYGANRGFVFRIFFFEGLLIAGTGIVIGLVLGTGICIAQVYGSLLEMPNSGGEAFPIAFSWQDGVMIVGLVSLLSTITSALPVWYLVRKSG